MSNPYLSWPLWHNFTLHFQNLSAIGDRIQEFRAISTTGKAAEQPLVSTMMRDIVVYDFINDRIARLSEYPDVLLITGPATLTDMIKSKQITNRAYVVIKAKPEATGDMIPLIGSAIY